jgi:sucrose-6-phosphate hydrolase SacC (GH32 family)
MQPDISLCKNSYWKKEGIAFCDFHDGVIHSGDKNFDIDNKGKLISHPITIDWKYLVMDLRVAGWDNETSLRIHVDGDLQFLLSDTPEAVEQLYAFDLTLFQGKTMVASFIDAGSCEGITVKNIRLTDLVEEKAIIIAPICQCEPLDITLELQGCKFVNFPIKKNYPTDFCSFSVDGVDVLNMGLRLAKDGQEDYIASVPVDEYGGTTIRIHSDEVYIPKKDRDAFYKKITVSETPVQALRNEVNRPKLHMTPPFGGNGDMIGFFYYGGKYHAGYLCDPAGDLWNSNASWAFCESDDLLHWDNHRIIVRKGHGTKRSSGCGFVDHKNASGLKTGKDDPILLFYSVENQAEQRYQEFCSFDRPISRPDMLSKVSIKYSTDGGKTFTEYENNPIFYSKCPGGHDPEVFYYEPEDKYILVFHDRDQAKWGFGFYESKDLLHWTYLGAQPGYWETPNMYRLPLDGDESNQLWVLQQCNNAYCVGKFDGRSFTPITDMQQTFKGGFAMRTFQNGNRRILMATMGVKSFGGNTNISGGASFPVDLSLRSTKDGIWLFYEPVPELEKYVENSDNYKDITAEEFNKLNLTSELLQLEISCQEDLKLCIGNVCIFEYSQENSSYNVLNRQGKTVGPGCNVKFILDHPVVSYYTDGGFNAGNVTLSHLNEPENLIISCDGPMDITVKKFRSPYSE